MHLLNNGSQVPAKPASKPRVGAGGFFSESGENGAPSYPGQDWFNAVISEFQNALVAQGVGFDPNKFDHFEKLLVASGVRALQYRVGQRVEIHSAQIPAWLVKADGSTLSRGVDDVLWAHVENSGLLIAQATKDADPETYAMNYGDGDGSTTFSLPNWYLGHFARANPAGVALGEVQGDAIRSLSGGFYINSAGGGTVSLATVNPSGVFNYDSIGQRGEVQVSSIAQDTVGVNFDASRVVPVADENRPKSGHINVCIERGKIPA